MAVLLAWLSHRQDQPDPRDWNAMLARAASRSRFPGRTLSAPGARLFVAPTRAAEPEAVRDSDALWRAADAAPGWGGLDAAPQASVRAPCALLEILPLERRLRLTRDLLGQRKLVYARIADGIVVASGEDVLVGHSEVSDRLDEQYLAAFLVSQPADPARTIFADIAILRPGETLRWQDGRLTDSLASLLPDESWRVRTEAEIVDEFRDRMLDAVGFAIRGADRVGLSMSAGIDSSIIGAALAATDKNFTRRPLAVTFGLDHWPDIDESSLASTQAAALGLEHICFAADELWPLSSQGVRPTCPDTPVASPFREIKETTYQKFVDGKVDVWLSGNFGDHLWADPADWLIDGWKNRRWRFMWSHFRWSLASSGATGIWRNRGIRKCLRLASGKPNYWTDTEYLQDDVARQLRQRLDAELAACGEFPRPLHAYQVLNARAAFDACGENWFAQRHGMEVRMPFRDPPLVRFCLSLPCDFSFRSGIWKWLPRRAFAGCLRSEILERPKSSDLTAFVDESTGADSQKWDQMAREGMESAGWLLRCDPDSVENPDSRWNLRWNLISLSLWQKARLH
ncbi:MAG: hypothetical protein IT479_06540 [Xanthomonadales bacterium]|nr:hypothetical protein [Xanthomonadales bacterium]